MAMKRATGGAKKKAGGARKGAARKGAARKGAARKGAARKGAARKGAARKGAARKGAARKGAARKGAARKGAARKGAARKGAARKGARAGSRRELISPRGNRRFVRRKKGGQFGEMVDAARSIAQDRGRKAKRRVPSGQGDRGDRA